MALKESNTTIQGAVTKEMKKQMKELAKRHHRTLSKEVAYALSLYIEQNTKEDNSATTTTQS